MHCLRSGSTPTVGSSRMSSSGSWSSAAARDARRCWPPDRLAIILDGGQGSWVRYVHTWYAVDHL